MLGATRFIITVGPGLKQWLDKYAFQEKQQSRAHVQSWKVHEILCRMRECRPPRTNMGKLVER